MVNLTLLLFSISVDKLSAVVPRILNKEEAFISGQLLHLCSSSLFFRGMPVAGHGKVSSEFSFSLSTQNGKYD